MNETEIKEMETEVGRPDPKFEIQWAKAMLEKAKLEESTLQSAWHMWKFARNDQRLAETKANLDQNRSCIKYLENLSRELAGPRPS